MLAQILLAAHGVDDGACRKEEQGFEEGMGHEMEDGCRVSRDAAAQEHVTELRDCGVGEDAFDVGLNQAHGGGEQSRGCSDDCNYAKRKGRVVEAARGCGRWRSCRRRQ